jgi:hypothetical protein
MRRGLGNLFPLGKACRASIAVECLGLGGSQVKDDLQTANGRGDLTEKRPNACHPGPIRSRSG